MKELIIDESDGQQTRLIISDDTYAIVQTSVNFEGVREYRPPVVLTKRGILNLHRAITNEIIGL